MGALIVMKIMGRGRPDPGRRPVRPLQVQPTANDRVVLGPYAPCPGDAPVSEQTLTPRERFPGEKYAAARRDFGLFSREMTIRDARR